MLHIIIHSVQSCPTLRPHELQHTKASLTITSSWSLPKLMSIELVMPSNDLILRRPLLLSVLPSIRVFSSESALHIKWPKEWSFSVSIRTSNEYSKSTVGNTFVLHHPASHPSSLFSISVQSLFQE